MLTCVELGDRLAAVARRKLAGFPDVEVVTADFETWQPERGGFDAVVAFSSFHWIAPELRYRKAADLLRAHGALALVSTVHVLPVNGDPFFVDVQRDYEAVVPDDPQTCAGVAGPPRPDAIAALSDEVVTDELRRSGRSATPRAAALRLGRDLHRRGLRRGARHLLGPSGARRRDARAPARAHPPPDRGPARPTVRKTYLALLYVAERV